MYQAPREAGGRETIAPNDAPQNLGLLDATSYFRLAIQSLLGSLHAGRIANLLGDRVHRTTVYNWLTGRRPPPVWAIETARQLLTDRAERDLAITRTQFRRGPDRVAWGNQLGPIRRQKEKARQQGGPV
jgi:hypothetical protein